MKKERIRLPFVEQNAKDSHSSQVLTLHAVTPLGGVRRKSCTEKPQFIKFNMFVVTMMAIRCSRITLIT